MRRASACVAGDYNDLHEFDTEALAWTDLGSPDSAPPPRDTLGFTADGGGDGGGRLFVFGGWSVDLDCEFGGRQGGGAGRGGAGRGGVLGRSNGGEKGRL